MNLEAIDSRNGHRLNCFYTKAIELPSKIWTIETGEDSLTGERVKRCIEAFPDEQYFVTYGDGLANIDLKALIDFHENHHQLATITAVHPPARFGHLNIADDLVTGFGEKNQMLEGWINGGYFILDQSVRNFFNEKNESFEFDVLPRIVESNQLRAYKHQGFWHAMDTLRDKIELESLAKLSPPPWQK
jgi:glucose-1-phosphate cytidylyltransferase